MLLLYMHLQLLLLKPLEAFRALLCLFLLYYGWFHLLGVVLADGVVFLVHFVGVVDQHVLIFKCLRAQRTFRSIELLQFPTLRAVGGCFGRPSVRLLLLCSIVFVLLGLSAAANETLSSLSPKLSSGSPFDCFFLDLPSLDQLKNFALFLIFSY